VSGNKPSYAKLVTQALIGARRPLTLDEVRARVELLRPLTGRNPRGTLRGAMNGVHGIATPGGRPARYTWWPCHLRDNAFRQPLARSDLQAGTLAMNDEVWLALWPEFYAGPTRSAGEVTLELDAGPAIRAQVTHLAAGEARWGLDATPALAAWMANAGRGLRTSC